jgi:hypothetical protein
MKFTKEQIEQLESMATVLETTHALLDERRVIANRDYTTHEEFQTRYDRQRAETRDVDRDLARDVIDSHTRWYESVERHRNLEDEATRQRRRLTDFFHAVINYELFSPKA